MRTLFLNPPSYDDFDGGAGSRYQAKREVWSFWYPTWLCYPAGMLPGSRVLDAPPHNVSVDEAVPQNRRAARAFVTEFIEEAKASGLVRRALDMMGLKSSQVAPVGMKA